MMFQWTPDMVRFMRDASEYGDYNRKLAEQIAPWLLPGAHICDAGCGLGYLSLALAPYAGRVTAADTNSDALSVLAGNCRAQGIGNVALYHGDLFALPPETLFDHMVFCFFGDVEEVATLARRHCRGQVFIIQRNYSVHRFSSGEYARGHSFAQSQDWLRQHGVPFEARSLELEFGQPFRSWADARLFFETYDRSGGGETVTDTFLRERVHETGRSDFPLYMPHNRAIGWLRFDAGSFPAE